MYISYLRNKVEVEHVFMKYKAEVENFILEKIEDSSLKEWSVVQTY